MIKRAVFLLGLCILAACQRQPLSVPLEGKWKLQRIIQADYTRERQLRQRGKMPRSSSTYTYLTFTDRVMVYHFQGDSVYAITNPYTRRDDTLRIVLDGTPPEDPFIETIIASPALACHAATLN